MTAMSFSMATTVPLMTEPSSASDLPKDSSSSAAKSSRDGDLSCCGHLFSWVGQRARRRRLVLRLAPPRRAPVLEWGARFQAGRRGPTMRSVVHSCSGPCRSANGDQVSLSGAWRSCERRLGACPPRGVDKVHGRPERRSISKLVVSSKRASRRRRRAGRSRGPSRARRACGYRPARRRRSPSRRAPRARGTGGGRAPRAAAVTKIFTSASGQITVPMSRPSSTAPSGRLREGALPVDQRRRAPPGSPPRRRPPRPSRARAGALRRDARGRAPARGAHGGGLVLQRIDRHRISARATAR